MTEAKLNQDEIATLGGNITVFNFDEKTREYRSSSVEYLAVGTGIPAYACIDEPPEKIKGKAICRAIDGLSWQYVSDHRGEIAYHTDNRVPFEITLPGDYPEGTTTKSPATSYDIWNGTDWVTDDNAKKAADISVAKQQKASLMAEAQTKISLWQTELQLGIISDDDKASLIDWLAYIKALQVVNPDGAPEINWPDPPEAPAR